MTASGTLRAVPLVCPACGNPLEGLPEDVVFGCSGCGTAFEVGPAGEFEAHPFFSARPGGAEARNEILLPFWCFQLEASPPVPGLSLVYVSAFDLRRRQYFGDPGFDLTNVQPSIERTRPAALRGAVIPCNEASVLGRFEVLRFLEMHRRIDEDRPVILLGPPGLLTVGFGLERDHVIHPWTGTRYSTHAFPDLARLSS